MFWRPIPGFVASPESFLPSRALWERFRADLATAVVRGQLAEAVDSDDVMRMLTAVITGVTSQQLANEPAAWLEFGTFTRLADRLLDIFFAYYAPTTRKRKS
jgi:hypothetical protein